MTTANEILKTKLNALAARLQELNIDHSTELRDIRGMLVDIDRCGSEPLSFMRQLRDLAAAVIDVRKTGKPLMRDLPVPPYDLWLPFKARDLASSDSEDIADAIEIFKEFNHMVNFPFAQRASNGS